MKKGLIVLGIGALLAMSSIPSWSMESFGQESSTSLRQSVGVAADNSVYERNGICDGTGPRGPNGGGRGGNGGCRR